MDKFHHFNIKDEHTCVVCGEKTEDSIRIVEDGYVSFPYNCPICDHHIKTKKIGASYFFKVVITSYSIHYTKLYDNYKRSHPLFKHFAESVGESPERIFLHAECSALLKARTKVVRNNFV